MIEELLKFNKQFVENKDYEKFITTKFPDKKIAIVSCMDARLTELLPASLGLKNGDAKVIKNAGGLISHPFGSAMRSLLIAIYQLGVKEIMIIAHSDCGVLHMNSKEMMALMMERGISEDAIKMMRYCGIKFDSWLSGFEDTGCSVRESIDMVRRHPLIPSDIVVRGFIINSVTGELREVD